MSREACRYVALLYNLIEESAPWPQGTQKARAAFLEKDARRQGEVMNYRILLMLSALYRKWASIRLNTMQSWVNRWSDPDMYAGAGNLGACDAWYDVAVELENMKLQGQQYCGGTADIMKCFEQIIINSMLLIHHSIVR